MLSLARSKLQVPTFRILMVAAGLLFALMFTPPGRWMLVRGPDTAQIALDVRLDEVHFDSVTVAQALKSIGDRAHVDVEVNWPGIRQLVPVVEPISLHLHNVTVREAMLAAFESSGIAFETIEIEPTGRIVRIGLAGSFAANATLRLYDVNKLVDEDLDAHASWQKPAAPRHGQSAPNGQRKSVGNNAAFAPSLVTRRSCTEAIAEVISQSYASGRMQAGDEIFVQSDLIAVSRPKAGHQTIQQTLKLLQSTTAKEAGLSRIAGTPLGVTEAALRVKIPDLTLEKTSLHDAIRRLHEMTHINVIVPADIAPTRTFSLHVQDVNAEQALHMICLMASDDITDLAIRYRGDGIFTIIPAAAREEGIPAVYDVSDLVDAIAHTDAPHVGDAEGTTETWEIAIEGLARLLQSEVDPDSWAENAGSAGTLRIIGRRFLIEQNPLNHRRIERLFKTLRNEFLGAPIDKSDLTARLKAIGPDQDEHFADYADPLVLTIPEFKLDGVTVMGAIEQLKVMSNVKFAYAADDLAEADIDLRKRIYIRAKEVSVGTAAKLALDAVAAPGTVELKPTISRRIVVGRSRQEAPTRIYDVRDLLNLPSTSLAAEDSSRRFDWEYDAVDNLRSILVALVDPDSWKDNGGSAGDVQYLGGRFIIHQTLKNHAAIEQFVQHLRGERGRKRKIGSSLRDRWNEHVANEDAATTRDSETPKPERE